MPNSFAVSLSAFWCDEFQPANAFMADLQERLRLPRLKDLSEIAGVEGRVFVFFLRAELAVAQSLACGVSLEQALQAWRSQSLTLVQICQEHSDSVQLFELSDLMAAPALLERFLPPSTVERSDRSAREIICDEPHQPYGEVALLAFAHAAVRADPRDCALLQDLRQLQNWLAGDADEVADPYAPGALVQAYRAQQPSAQVMSLMQARESALVAEVESLVQRNIEMETQHLGVAQAMQRLGASEARCQEISGLLKLYLSELQEEQERTRTAERLLAEVRADRDRIVGSKTYRILAPLRAARAILRTHG